MRAIAKISLTFSFFVLSLYKSKGHIIQKTSFLFAAGCGRILADCGCATQRKRVFNLSDGEV